MNRRIRVNVFLALMLGAPVVHAAVVERVVAVVGEQAILLSDLRQRARPFLLQINQKVPPGAQRAAAESQLLSEMLQRMVDERVEGRIANKHGIQASSEDVDRSIERLAQMQGMTSEELIGEAMRGGMTAQEYRSEIRRQVLEGKLLDLRVKGQVRVTDEKMRAAYDRMVRQERKSLAHRPQWIVLRVAPGASAAEREERKRMAKLLVQRARSGEDFAKLARQYSDDSGTKTHGGDLGRQLPGELDPVIERQALELDVGQVSDPFLFSGSVVVLRMAARDRSELGSFESVRDMLAQRVFAEEMEKAKRRWLKRLRQRLHVDVRL